MSHAPTMIAVSARVEITLRDALKAECERLGISTSEFIRSLIMQWATGQTLLIGPDEGYLAGRAIGYQVARIAVTNIMRIMPDSVEDAQRFILQNTHGH